MVVVACYSKLHVDNKNRNEDIVISVALSVKVVCHLVGTLSFPTFVFLTVGPPSPLFLHHFKEKLATTHDCT